MKHVLALFLSLSISIFSYAENKDAIEYNDKIVAEQTKIGETILAFSENPNEFSLNQILIQSDKSLEVLNKMRAFEGNKDFLTAAKKLYKFYGDITKNEYRKILDLISDKNDYTTDEINEKVNTLILSVGEKEKPLDQHFQDAQIAFANKYNFTLSKNELEDKINELKEE